MNNLILIIIIHQILNKYIKRNLMMNNYYKLLNYNNMT